MSDSFNEHAWTYAAQLTNAYLEDAYPGPQPNLMVQGAIVAAFAWLIARGMVTQTLYYTQPKKGE